MKSLVRSRRAESASDAAAPVLEVEHLAVSFDTRYGMAEVVSDVSFSLAAGETVALVGESGSGKSVTALSIMRLLDTGGRITGGRVRLEGRDLTELTEREYRAIRGQQIGMIFQDPTTCLDPVYSVGHQIVEALQIHTDLSKREAKARAVELLDMVGIPDPGRRVRSYQHELSGGQRQRVMIAMALACSPRLLIADEPTTALDVTVQAQILALLQRLQADTGTAQLLITHDLAVVAEMAERVVVMYAGNVVEQGPARQVLHDPQHPYTRALLKSMPGAATDRTERLAAIEGTVPAPSNMPRGCRFAARCDHAMPRCVAEAPVLAEWRPNHETRCWLHDPDVVVPRRKNVNA
ncbi:MAG: ABC transporter ATP-binding protein [Acidimicrobiia bacterium]|nr:ABC transporter ATP-binding protein [Acidimicrobiia bacterium]